MIILEELAVPLEGEDPAGENLEYDPLYLEMDSLAAAVPDSQMGESWIEGRGPDWKKLRENCLSLWTKTRDLRVASYLAVAETAAGSLEDCLGGFKLILFLIRDMWEPMYPRLDPEDGLDPTERLNILTMLSPEPGAFNDPIMFISKFRALRLVPALPYTLRDHLVSINEFEAAGGQAVDPNLITGELRRSWEARSGGGPLESSTAEVRVSGRISGWRSRAEIEVMPQAWTNANRRSR
jgi:hypothetical protein